MIKSSILFLLIAFFSTICVAEDIDYYSTLKTQNTVNGIVSVYIMKRIGSDGCKTQLESDKKFQSSISGLKIISAECIKESNLAGDYLKAFNMKPISRAMYIAFKNEIWSTRVIMYNVDSSWLTQQGCDYLLQSYKKFDSQASCVFAAM